MTVGEARHRGAATAKINLALVVGPLRADGKHEVRTVLQRLDLADRVEVTQSTVVRVHGFPADTLVHGALATLAERACAGHAWTARLEKHIPVAAGLGGGSADAGTALRLANATLRDPLPAGELDAIAAGLGADVPFFLRSGPQLGSGDGSVLEPLELPQDYWVVLLLPHGAVKESTATVYREFDRRGGETGFAARAAELADALGRVRRARDLALLPPNDLVRSRHSDALRAHGAFRADVSGAGPAVYGLFLQRRHAEAAAAALRAVGRTWLTVPAWYG